MPCIQFLVDCRSVRTELDWKLLLCTNAAVKSNLTFFGKLSCSCNMFVSGVLMWTVELVSLLRLGWIAKLIYHTVCVCKSLDWNEQNWARLSGVCLGWACSLCHLLRGNTLTLSLVSSYSLSHTGFVYTKWIVMFCLFNECQKSFDKLVCKYINTPIFSYLHVYCDMEGANVAVGQHKI